MKSWGGKRKGAGRPSLKKVKLGVVVLPETKAKIGRIAFNLVISAGEVIDRLVGRYKEKMKMPDVKLK